MKKQVLFICFIILFMNLSITVLGNDINFSRISKNIIQNQNVIWDGKEWITNSYPPEISEDRVFFQRFSGSDEVKNTLANTEVGYLWTGNDYLVYHTYHDYRRANEEKHIYRLSKDMNKILNTYTIPNWINYIIQSDGVYYIATENVYPVYMGQSQRINGERKGDFGLYYSEDLENWTKINIDFDMSILSYRPSLFKVNNNLLLADYYNPTLGQYTKECRNVWYYSIDKGLREIAYESVNPMQISKCNDLLYTQSISAEEPKLMLFSVDGIYWGKIPLPETMYISFIYENADHIVIEGISNNEKKYYGCPKEIFSNILNNINNVYVMLNNKILGFEQPPIIENGRTLVPMRFLFEQMGAEVDWNTETQTATATLDNTSVTFAIDDTEAEVNSRSVKMDVPARLVNERTMVPLRFLSEKLGFTVNWDEKTRTAVIE